MQPTVTPLADAEAPALEGPAKKAKKAPKKGKAIAVVDLTAKVKSETKKKPAKKEKKAPKQGKAIAVVDLTATDSAAIEIASPKKERFVIPRPGVGNAVADALDPKGNRGRSPPPGKGPEMEFRPIPGALPGRAGGHEASTKCHWTERTTPNTHPETPSGTSPKDFLSRLGALGLILRGLR